MGIDFTGIDLFGATADLETELADKYQALPVWDVPFETFAKLKTPVGKPEFGQQYRLDVLSGRYNETYWCVSSVHVESMPHGPIWYRYPHATTEDKDGKEILFVPKKRNKTKKDPQKQTKLDITLAGEHGLKEGLLFIMLEMPEGWGVVRLASNDPLLMGDRSGFGLVEHGILRVQQRSILDLVQLVINDFVPSWKKRRELEAEANKCRAALAEIEHQLTELG